MGPLEGVKIVEIGGIGPGPFCAQMLADMGANIIRLERKSTDSLFKDRKYQTSLRGRPTIEVDLKKKADLRLALAFIDKSDALIEGFRPGVMEKLGLGPDKCLARNPGLVYGRMTGWGQTGPLAESAGHDINFISLSGVLHAIGMADNKPIPPLNLVGDFGGGGLLLAFGILCGLYEAGRSGKGQIIDASMVDGSAVLMGDFYGLHALGEFSDRRGTNIIDGGSHFYNTYETADGKWIAIGCMEPKFYELFLKKMQIEDDDFKEQYDKSKWPVCIQKLTRIFKTKSRSEWCDILENSEVCFSPVLDYREAVAHRHNQARKTFEEIDGVVQPAPAPRFSRTVPEIRQSTHTTDFGSILTSWGFSSDEANMVLKQKAAFK